MKTEFNKEQLIAVPDASENEAGIVTKATDTEVLDGINDTKYVTSKQVKDNYGFEFGAGTDLLAGESIGAVSSDSTVLVKLKELECPVGGDYTVKFGLSSNANLEGANVEGQIYVNDIAVGTLQSANVVSDDTDIFYEDITINDGDLVQIYGREADSETRQVRVSDFRITYSITGLIQKNTL